MLFTLLALSRANEHSSSSLAKFMLGEWIITPNHAKGDSGRLYIEVHENEKRQIMEATLWRDDMNSTEVMTIDNYLLGYYEVEFETDFSGQVYSVHGTRSLLTDFAFQPVPNTITIMTKVKLDANTTMQLTFLNGTYFSAVVAHKGVSLTDEYTIKRADVVDPIATSSSMKRWMYIGLAVVVVQLLLFLCLRCCRSSLNSRIDRVRSEMVIDLDKFHEKTE